ncbi:glycoside hydrolase family 78 protein [Nonomuraea sp. 3-1Str]|uniref:family 78 glycoside hydrolase catalytic domain n=1 Tax=Nonomuraea sp. 3-1Str TaxID=2929801 RepID=UPI0028662DDF|nr:family 78 glycoside hydrolase catalytic domain [Nonomuraea sp. 3-1Str]MDR8409416.1 glycoside hydrolase family 78 protein [Nonomuraea sp. 3-1Str]
MPSLTPYGLTCELLEEPLGLDEPRPRLSWRLASDRRGDTPAAYRLRVAARPEDLDEPGRLLWDTDLAEPPETPYVRYDGPPLQSGTRYHWRVSLWDAAGAPAGEATSWFETGLLHAGDWTAAWIGEDPALIPIVDPPADDDRTERTRPLNPSPHLRRAFRLDAAAVRARVYVSARGLYELSLNGRRVGDHELAPGWTDYRERVPYQVHDVTDLLREGENVLGAILADGWWSGYVGFDARHQALHYGTAPQLLAQLVVDFADGSRRVVATDGTWRTRRGPIVYGDLLMGERFDARLALTGWDAPRYDDQGWTPAVVLDRDLSALTATTDRPVRAVAELPAVSVTPRGDGRHIADLGQNMVGRVRLTLRGLPRGTAIRLRHAEMLDDGELYLDNLRTAEATDHYVAAGEPVEVFEPRFTFHGFRYVEVSGLPGPLRAGDVTGVVLMSDTPAAGEFHCSDPVVTQLQANIVWGQRGNFVSVPTDCPQRDERLGWLADAQVFLPTAARNADVAAFFARWMRDVVSGQDADGAFPNVAPKVCVTQEGAPAWGDAGVIIPWHLYKAYGDVRVLERSYPAMTAWVEHVRRHNPDLIWRSRVGQHYGDWLQIGVETPREVLATAYFARSAQLTAQAAAVLGRKDDAAAYGELHRSIREAFAEAFVEPDGRVAGGTQTAYLLALAFDLLPGHLVPAAADHLAADVEARGRHLTTGFLGVSLLCPVLTEHGHADLAYALLHQDEFPSWCYSIRHGATTIWERWDGWTEEGGFQSANMNSFNHYALGSVGDWLYGRVAGIDQDSGSVAYRRLLLRPTVGGRLSWARAHQETPYGRVACGWHREDGGVRVEASVPPGATAVLHVPTSDAAAVREGGLPVEAAEGVRVAGEWRGVLAVELASGDYAFTAPL